MAEQKLDEATKAPSGSAKLDAETTSAVDSAAQKPAAESGETRVTEMAEDGKSVRESVSVTLGLENLALSQGAPSRRVWVPSRRPLPIRVTAPSGAYIQRIRAAMPAAKAQQEFTQRRFEGRPLCKRIDMLGRVLSRPTVALEKQTNNSATKAAMSRLSWRVDSSGSANRWSFMVTDKSKDKRFIQRVALEIRLRFSVGRPRNDLLKAPMALDLR